MCSCQHTHGSLSGALATWVSPWRSDLHGYLSGALANTHMIRSSSTLIRTRECGKDVLLCVLSVLRVLIAHAVVCARAVLSVRAVC